MIDALTGGLLRRHVRGRAEDGADAREPTAALRAYLRDAEVEHLHEVLRPSPLDQHDVVGLQIAVNDAGGVRGAEAAGHLACDEKGALDGERRVGADELGEALALDVLEHEIERAVGELAEIRRHGDVRVVDAAGRDRLELEPLHDLRHGRHFAVQYLHRDGLAHQDVLTAVHGAHAADAELLVDPVPVVADGRPEERIDVGFRLAGAALGVARIAIRHTLLRA